MIIDAHAHLFHSRWYPAVFQRLLLDNFLRPRTGRRVSTAKHKDIFLRMLTDDDGSRTIASMNDAGIDQRIILVIDWGLELGEPECSIRQLHEQILGVCSRSHNRLIGFAGFDPRRPEATELLTWAFDHLGARGLKLHPTSASWRLTDDRACRLVGIAASRRLPVLVHMGDTLSLLTSENATPAALAWLARQFPAVPFIVGHSGFSLWREFLGSNQLSANVYFDVSGWQSFLPGAQERSEELRALCAAFPGRVLFGTDSPFYGLSPGSARNWVEELSRSLAPHQRESFFANPILRGLTPARNGERSHG